MLGLSKLSFCFFFSTRHLACGSQVQAQLSNWSLELDLEAKVLPASPLSCVLMKSSSDNTRSQFTLPLPPAVLSVALQTVTSDPGEWSSWSLSSLPSSLHRAFQTTLLTGASHSAFWPLLHYHPRAASSGSGAMRLTTKPASKFQGFATGKKASLPNLLQGLTSLLF